MAQVKSQGAAKSAKSNGAPTRTRSSGAASRSTTRKSTAKPKTAAKRQARSVKQTAGTVASKAKVPALATGAAAAGLAGGVLLSAKSRSRGLMPRRSGMAVLGTGLIKTAESVGKASTRMGELTEEVRLVREGVEQGGKRRSPIETVLDGLTRRRG